MSNDPRSIIRKVLITEKGTMLREVHQQYFFEVARGANKIEIKRAVEEATAGFDVALVEVGGVRFALPLVEVRLVASTKVEGARS